MRSASAFASFSELRHVLLALGSRHLQLFADHIVTGHNILRRVVEAGLHARGAEVELAIQQLAKSAPEVDAVLRLSPRVYLSRLRLGVCDMLCTSSSGTKFLRT